MENVYKLPERLKALRKEQDISQGELAKIAGVTAAAISSYERESDPKFPPVKTLIKFAETFRVSLDWLCGIDDEQLRGLNTYQDAIQAFAALGDAFDLTVESEKRTPETPFDSPEYKLTLTFDDSTLLDFVQSWSKIYSLYKSGTIDHSLYSLWLKQESSKSIYKAKIGDEFPF